MPRPTPLAKSLRAQARRLHAAWRAASPEGKPALQAQLRAVLVGLEPHNQARAARWAKRAA